MMTRRTSVDLNFVEAGEGIPVLALHGWTPDHRLMLGCMEPVFAGRAGYRRLYPDLPGMGKSPAPSAVASSDDVIDVVQDFVDEVVGNEPFLLVGESYGGYLARALVRLRPEQVRGLALICPLGTELEQRTVPGQQVLRPDPELISSLDERLAEQFTTTAVVQSPQTLRRFVAEIQPGLDVADAEAMARIRQRWRLTEDPESGAPFEKPTLIITGRQDSSVGYQNQFTLLPHYPRASFAVLDIAGHNLQIDQPGLFEALLVEWLSRVATER